MRSHYSGVFPCDWSAFRAYPRPDQLVSMHPFWYRRQLNRVRDNILADVFRYIRDLRNNPCFRYTCRHEFIGLLLIRAIVSYRNNNKPTDILLYFLHFLRFTGAPALDRYRKKNRISHQSATFLKVRCMLKKQILSQSLVVNYNNTNLFDLSKGFSGTSKDVGINNYDPTLLFRTLPRFARHYFTFMVGGNNSAQYKNHPAVHNKSPSLVGHNDRSYVRSLPLPCGHNNNTLWSQGNHGNKYEEIFCRPKRLSQIRDTLTQFKSEAELWPLWRRDLLKAKHLILQIQTVDGMITRRTGDVNWNKVWQKFTIGIMY